MKEYTSPNHLIQYDDGDEEALCLENEKVEWVSCEKPAFRRRLRKLSFLKESPAEGSNVLLEDCLQGNGGIGRSSKRSRQSDAGLCNAEENVINKSNSEEDIDDDDDGDDVKSAVKVKEEYNDLDFDEDEDAKPRKTKRIVKQEAKKGTKNTLRCTSAKTNAQNQSATVCKGSKNVLDGPTVMEATHSVHEQLNSKCPGSNGDIHIRLSGEAAERFGLRAAEKFKFLDKDRRDASGNRPGDPDYNPCTLFLPTEFTKGLSAGQRQWWEFKSKHMDKVTLFKMGKFYEMFEMDAHVGAQCLDLQYMKGNQPHCGFPEKNFEENAGKLAKMGYRVLVVEQVETPGQLEERNMKSGTKDKVVKREICGVITKGIITEGEMLTCSPNAAYLMATFEISNEESLNGSSIIGLCFLDAATSRFLVGQCSDDLARSRLRSILSELRPVELVKPAGLLTVATEKVLKEETRNPLITSLTPGLEFWDAEKTMSELVTFFCEKCGNVDDKPDREDGLQALPEFLQNLAQAGAKAKAAISALGGCISYLRQALLDRQLLGSGRFELLPGSDSFLEPPCKHSSNFDSTKKEDSTFSPKIFADNLEPYMVLDSSALENLDILESSHDGSTQGTLLAQLDHCVTAFGRRLLRQWIVRPLICVDSIVDRQNAIEDIKGVAADAASKFRKDLLKLPDMERMVVRLKSYNEKTGRNAHAVVLYEDAAKKLLKEFLGALRGFQIVNGILSSFSMVSSKFRSRRLQSLFTLGAGVQDLPRILKYFEDAFDWLDAEKSGRITPHEGVDAEFDLRSENVATIKAKLEAYLKEQKEYFKNQCIAFVTVGKDRFQLEIPDSLQKKVPPEYSVESQRKGFRRYSTPIVKQLLADLVLEEEHREAALNNILQGLLARFGENYSLWLFVVQSIAELDALISLMLASNSIVGATCKPVISIINSSSDSSTPFLLAKGLRHPILEGSLDGGRSFVPNDINLGGSQYAPFMLLTGPNMGGKSTLLRQVCLAVILAQIGAYVPAEDFRFSPIDRVFVRMGAKDHIMAAQSTFLVELLETSSMLTSATPHSLVALDELGRGTATSDGQAIAHAVLEHLAHKVGCLGMFSTHYHRLANDHTNDSTVALHHMACKVEDCNAVENVTFLYKLASGACPKSYGVNVARIAGMPESILRRAAVRSAEMEGLESTQALKGYEEKLFVEAVQIARKADCAELGVMANLRDRWRSLHATQIPLLQKC